MQPIYIKNFLDTNQADLIFNSLLKLDWIKATEAREEYFMYKDNSLNYTYGNGLHKRTYKSSPFTKEIKDLMNLLNSTYNRSYDVCFLNKYNNQKNQLGWHADDSPEMDSNHPILVLSLGAEREIWHKLKDYKGEVPKENKTLLENGSIYIMPSGFQLDHFHKIPKADREVGIRISLTFRKYKNN